MEKAVLNPLNENVILLEDKNKVHSQQRNGHDLGKGVGNMDLITLPVGIDSFERIRQEGYYYVDKTEFISRLLRKTFEVNLITRPRRFGKTLAINMLASFFDITKNSSSIFAGLNIEKEKELCATYMNQWPVLSLSLKNVEGLTFSYAYDQLQSVVSDCCLRMEYLHNSENVNPYDKELFERLVAKKGTKEEVDNSVFTLTRMLFSHFEKPVIVLIDEYDVPLAKASENGYYSQMLESIRSLLGKALKSNEFLKFSIITGCLRIVKESIFTGTNNLVTDSISGERFSEYFGFTRNEVFKLLEQTGFTEHSDEIQAWYDGYRFGTTDLFCPWDVLNHVNRLQDQPDAKPEPYWKNTSHNGIIRSFLGRSDLMVNEKFETLLSGGVIHQKITEDLTYDILHSNEDNIWTILYLTGYLTLDGDQGETQDRLRGETQDGSRGETQDRSRDESLDGLRGETQLRSRGDLLRLRIPNKEIESIFAETVMEWFQCEVGKRDRQTLFHALWTGDCSTVTRLLSDLLFETISYYDYDEHFYHAFLGGVFSGAGFAVESNYQYGLGRPDLVITDKPNRRAIIIETKKAHTHRQLAIQCENGLNQMKEKQYAKGLSKGYREVICYSISFYAKECLAMTLKKPPIIPDSEDITADC